MQHPNATSGILWIKVQPTKNNTAAKKMNKWNWKTNTSKTDLIFSLPLAIIISQPSSSIIGQFWGRSVVASLAPTPVSLFLLFSSCLVLVVFVLSCLESYAPILFGVGNLVCWLQIFWPLFREVFDLFRVLPLRLKIRSERTDLVFL